jgi:hypothetical protein
VRCRSTPEKRTDPRIIHVKVRSEKSRLPGNREEITMSDVSHMAYRLAAAQLRLPKSEDYAVDGSRIGQKTQAMAASLPRIEPSVIISITRMPDYLASYAANALNSAL